MQVELRAFRNLLGIVVLALAGTYSMNAFCEAAPSQPPAAPLTLDQKLQRQFDRFQQAQDMVIEMTGRKGGMVSRSDWENLLQGAPDERLNDADLKALAERQEALIEKSAQHSRSISKFDLDKLRGRGEDDEMLGQFCSELPKGGLLHVHPSGTASHETVRKLLAAANPKVSFDSVSGMIKAFFVPGSYDFMKAYAEPTPFLSMSAEDQKQLEALFFTRPGHHPFQEFNGIFVVNGLYSSPESKEVVYNDFLARQVPQHVKYVEFTADSAINEKYLPQLEKWVAEWKAKYGIEVHFNYSFHRNLDPEKNRALAKALVELPPSSALTGIDLLADESSTPTLETGQSSYATVMAAVKDGRVQLRRMMHSGELGDPRDPRDAFILGDERLGHGVKLIDDVVALEYARSRRQGVEINLVSNYRLEAIDDLHHHPFLKYLRLGLRPSLSTDDEGILETDIDRECRTAITVSDVSYRELKQLVENSIETSFTTDAAKQTLLQQLKADFKDFESRWTPRFSQ